jgi:hypothetical protein
VKSSDIAASNAQNTAPIFYNKLASAAAVGKLAAPSPNLLPVSIRDDEERRLRPVINNMRRTERGRG